MKQTGKPDYKKLQVKAKDLFIKGKKQKEIAESLHVSSVTVSNWAKEGNWKSLRNAELSKSKNRVENINSIIDYLSEMQIGLIKQIKEAESIGDTETAKELREKMAGIADDASKWDKRRKDLEKDSRITLSVYLDVMDSIFSHLKNYDSKLYQETIDFQEIHAHDTSKRLG